jgi:conjugal transfer ATP-binding protein TraC
MDFLKNLIKKPKTVGIEPVKKDLEKSEERKVINETKKKDFTEGLVSIKDIIAPSSLEVDFNYVKIGDKYFRTLFVSGYPRFVGMNWLSSLINFDWTLNISMYIYPTDGKAILDDLRRKITEMEAELSTDIQRGRLVNPATQAKLEDALNLQADLVKGEERFFQFGLYINISADSKEDLDRINKNLEAALGSLLVVSKRATLQMEDGFVTCLPINSDRLGISRNMDTTSLATTFPFVSSDLSDDKGVMYGINAHNGSLIIFDRFSMPNYNSVVFATSGVGKSYMIKLEVLRSLMFGTEIIVIDPENEYKELAEAAGGQYIAFGYNEESKINPMDLSLVEEDGENVLNSKTLSVHKLMKVMLGELDPMEESILDKALMDAYKSKGITPDPATQNKEPPLIEDVYKALIGREEEKAQIVAARMEKYIKGSFAGIFNQKTTVNLTNQLVVFGIKNLEETLRPVAMHIILDYIWTIVKKTLKKRILVVDEAWYMMQYEDSAQFLRGVVKRGRKYYLGVTTITQDVNDFLKSTYGKEIVTNSSIQILLKQHAAAIDQVGEVFYLSEGEKQLLLTADKGQGLFFAGQNHVAIEVIASEEEHELITSDPEEVLRKRKLELVNEKKETPTTQPKPIPKTVINPSSIIEPQPQIDIPLVETPKKNEVEDILQKKIDELEKAEVKKTPLSGEIKLNNQNEESRFVPPKMEVLEPNQKQKPIFVKTEETNIPQPPQLAKKPTPLFENKTNNDESTPDDLLDSGII